MTDYQESTTQERMDLLREITEEMAGAIERQCRRWNRGEDGSGEGVRLLYLTDDGHILVEVGDEPVMTITYSVATAVVPGEYADKVNKPTGFALRKTWGEVFAGWFVLPPGAASVWWEVLAVDGDRFTLRNEQGQEGTWRRDLATDIPVRRGTNSKALDSALDALNGAGITTQVIEDRTS